MSNRELFRAYHRRRWVVTAAVRGAVIAGGAAFAVIMCMVAAAAPGSASEHLSEAAVPAAPANLIVDALPQPIVTASPSPTPQLVEVANQPAARETAWSITVDTVGYQTELDACLWVRMDLGAVAPFVGAHNHCGGDVILEMAVGDTVTLRGTSLDGDYVVASARDAFAGENAQKATDGMLADVILQTCYWHSNGRELLLALVRVT